MALPLMITYDMLNWCLIDVIPYFWLKRVWFEFNLSISSISNGVYWVVTWWRHQIETFSALLAICAGNSPAPGEFPTQRPVTRSFYIFLDLCLNKRLCKQSEGWWFETLSRPLWRQCNDIKWRHNSPSGTSSVVNIEFILIRHVRWSYASWFIAKVSWTLKPTIFSILNIAG